ncbi:MAG TPA: hypothetical protein VFC53_02800 [Dehalococcoidia bacterium]|nr:hypothetical protein [Dehalococcoidia bacterium]
MEKGDDVRKKRLMAAAGAMILAAAMASACVVINSSLMTFDSSDVFAGELHNYTAVDILGHDVEVAFKNENGEVIETQVVHGCLRSLQRGRSDFFEATSSSDAAVVAAATGKISYNSSFKVGTVAEGNLSITNVDPERTGSSLVVTGTLRNIGATLESPKACVVVRDPEDQVLRVGSDTVADLAHNQQATFSVTITVPSDDTLADHVDVYADGLEDGTPIVPSSSTSHSVVVVATSTPTATATATP